MDSPKIKLYCDNSECPRYKQYVLIFAYDMDGTPICSECNDPLVIEEDYSPDDDDEYFVEDYFGV